MNQIFQHLPGSALDILNGDDAIDLLAELAIHWKRNRERNYTPKAIRMGIVQLCHEISSKNLGVRTIEDRLNHLEEARSDHSERLSNHGAQITEVREQVLANMRASKRRTRT